MDDGIIIVDSHPKHAVGVLDGRRRLGSRPLLDVVISVELDIVYGRDGHGGHLGNIVPRRSAHVCSDRSTQIENCTLIGQHLTGMMLSDWSKYSLKSAKGYYTIGNMKIKHFLGLFN